MAFLPFVCVLAAGAVARADDLTSVDLREEVVSLRKQNAALTHRLAALEAARRDLRSDCADSTSWYYDYNPAKTCEAYVSKKSKNCKKKDEFKVKGEDACPLTCGACEIEEECADSTSWYWKKSKNDCDYVGKNPEDRCSLKDDDKVKSKDACPLSCGECEVEEECADSTSWYWKKSKYDCVYVGKNAEDRCSLKDDDKVKSKDACPLSCGECEVEVDVDDAASESGCGDVESQCLACGFVGQPSLSPTLVPTTLVPTTSAPTRTGHLEFLDTHDCAKGCGDCVHVTAAYVEEMHYDFSSSSTCVCIDDASGISWGTDGSDYGYGDNQYYQDDSADNQYYQDDSASSVYGNARRLGDYDSGDAYSYEHDLQSANSNIYGNDGPAGCQYGCLKRNLTLSAHDDCAYIHEPGDSGVEAGDVFLGLNLYAGDGDDMVTLRPNLDVNFVLDPDDGRETRIYGGAGDDMMYAISVDPDYIEVMRSEGRRPWWGGSERKDKQPFSRYTPHIHFYGDDGDDVLVNSEYSFAVGNWYGGDGDDIMRDYQEARSREKLFFYGGAGDDDLFTEDHQCWPGAGDATYCDVYTEWMNMYGGDGDDSCVLGARGANFFNDPLKEENPSVYGNQDYILTDCQSGVTDSNGCENDYGAEHLTACVEGASIDDAQTYDFPGLPGRRH